MDETRVKNALVPHMAKDETCLQRLIIISATFGSVMQRDVALRALTALLNTWTETVEGYHQKNEIMINET